MEYSTTTGAASRRAGGCIVVGVYGGGKLSDAAADVDSASGGRISALLKHGDIKAERGKCAVLNDVPGIRAQRVVVVGLGPKAKFNVSAYRRAIACAANAIKGRRCADLTNYLALEDVPDTSPYYRARYAVETIGHSLYSFDQMKSGRKKKMPALKKVCHAITKRGDARQSDLGSAHADAIVAGMSLSRDLGNLPPNVCTPSYLARTATKMASGCKALTTRIINETEMKRLGMGSLLSVTAGATTPAKLIVMQYKGAGRDKPVVFVGKGVTFDTGGISLKPGPAMDEMKFDMCGAASVIGAMQTLVKLKLRINVNVVVPAVENVPDANATLPGDIVTSMSGKTIEILNTDAEGRLILCDALTYSKRFKPALLIDVATLTGACVIALGQHRTGLMTYNEKSAQSILDAGIAADDRAWPLPLAEEYDRTLKSNFADMANIGSREAGATVAGCFLGRFTEGENWVHLDIAGVAYRTGAQKGATGRPVPLLTEIMLRHAGATP